MIKISLCPAVNLAISCSDTQETFISLLWSSAIPNFSQVGKNYVEEIFKNSFTIKPTRCTNFTNLFWHETLRVLDSSSVHHQEFIHVHSAMVYVIQVCRQLSSRTRMELQFHPGPARQLSTNLYDIYHC
jgi:hypothetical protein